MERIDLVRRVRTAAAYRGLSFELTRSTGSHEKWVCGKKVVLIPRHREIGEKLTLAIMQQLEDELGRDWWRE